MAWLFTGSRRRPHGGGEPVSAVLKQVANWLDRRSDVGRLGVVTSAAVLRAAILATLAAPPSAFWRVDRPADRRPRRLDDSGDGLPLGNPHTFE